MSGKVEGLVAKWRAEAQEAMNEQLLAALAISGCAEELAEAIAAEAQSVAAGDEVALSADDVKWIVNDIAELGVMIRGQAFFLYKGESLVYEDASHEDGRPMQFRPVFKREFGECCHPINYSDHSRIDTVSLDDSDEWELLPATQHGDNT